MVRVEWKAPFSYLKGLNQDDTSGEKKNLKTARKAKTSGVSAGSLPVSLSAPIGLSRHFLLHAFPCRPQIFGTSLYGTTTA